MANFNKVIFVGRLTENPRLSYTSSGVAVGGFRLAVNESFTNRNGDKKETCTFIPVVIWDKLAEVVKEYQVKGSEVLVEGRLRTNSWQDEQGNNRSRLEVHANRVEFIGPPRKKGTAEPPSEGEATSEV